MGTEYKGKSNYSNKNQINELILLMSRKHELNLLIIHINLIAPRVIADQLQNTTNITKFTKKYGGKN